MKRWELLSAVAGSILALGAIFGSLASSSHGVRSTSGVITTPNCQIFYTRYEPASVSADSTAIIFHGLSANRKLMQHTAHTMAGNRVRAFTIDMPGHGDSDAPFSFDRAEQCAAEFVHAVVERGEAQLDRLALIGHSAGGAIAIRLTEHFNVGATIAISPAPLTPTPGPWADATPFELPAQLPGNLLVFIASLDPFPIRDSARHWVEQAGGSNHSDAAFREQRALRLTDVPRAMHTSLLLDARVTAESMAWVQRALQMPGPVRAVTPPFAYAFVILGMMLIFPAAASAFARALAIAGGAPAVITSVRASRLVYFIWFAASLLSALVLAYLVPLRPLRMLGGDYLASFLLVTGLLAGVALWRTQGEMQAGGAAHFFRRATLLATLLAFACVIASGAILHWQVTDLWMNAARWARFPLVALAVLPYFLAEEWAVGPMLPGRAAVGRRLLRAMALRALVWAMMLLAFLLLASHQVLIPLLAAQFALFSIAQRLGADAIRRRCGSSAAAAIFNAILAAWFIAAVFPLV